MTVVRYMYSQPLIVKATTCWRVEWDELERNQSRFHALCHHLLNKVRPPRRGS